MASTEKLMEAGSPPRADTTCEIFCSTLLPPVGFFPWTEHLLAHSLCAHNVTSCQTALLVLTPPKSLSVRDYRPFQLAYT